MILVLKRTVRMRIHPISISFSIRLIHSVVLVSTVSQSSRFVRLHYSTVRTATFDPHRCWFIHSFQLYSIHLRTRHDWVDLLRVSLVYLWLWWALFVNWSTDRCFLCPENLDHPFLGAGVGRGVYESFTTPPWHLILIPFGVSVEWSVGDVKYDTWMTNGSINY